MKFDSTIDELVKGNCSDAFTTNDINSIFCYFYSKCEQVSYTYVIMYLFGYLACRKIYLNRFIFISSEDLCVLRLKKRLKISYLQKRFTIHYNLNK